MSHADSARRILALAWPVLVGQLAVIGFATVDTLLVARYDNTDLAALSVGSAAYATIFIGLMGVVLAIGPIVGQLFGARQLERAGRQLHQTVWLTLALSTLGCAVLVCPRPFLLLAHAPAEVERHIHGYLLALAVALPAALLMQAYRGFNNAISRPKAVMALQIGALVLKVPLSALLVFGWPAAGLPALGVLGCGIATAVVMWLQLAVAWAVLRRDPFYAPFVLHGRGLHRPERAALVALGKLGLPMGLSIMVEVSGFTLMAVFIARMGVSASGAHQIAANVASVMFMMPLALASASMTLVAQSVGAGDASGARRLARHGLQFGFALAVGAGGLLYLARAPVARLYTQDGAVLALAVQLLPWVALFHVADAVQAVAAFVLRAWHIATLPMFIYVGSLWGLGLGGGTLLAFDLTGNVPGAWQGPTGYWAAATAGLAVAALALACLLAAVLRRQRQAVMQAAAVSA